MYLLDQDPSLKKKWHTTLIQWLRTFCNQQWMPYQMVHLLVWILLIPTMTSLMLQVTMTIESISLMRCSSQRRSIECNLKMQETVAMLLWMCQYPLTCEVQIQRERSDKQATICRFLALQTSTRTTMRVMRRFSQQQQVVSALWKMKMLWTSTGCSWWGMTFRNLVQGIMHVTQVWWTMIRNMEVIIRTHSTPSVKLT